MILIDAIYINNGGGKILLDYLISQINKTNLEIHYLIDTRIENKHCKVVNGTFEYFPSNWLLRKKYYLLNEKKYNKVLCFANLPPNIKLDIPVFTYFHQPLFLKVESSLPFITKSLFWIKTIILSYILKNTDKWIVQSSLIKTKLSEKYKINLVDILIIPFYPSLKKPQLVSNREPIFLYVSNGEPHKNHKRLLEAFVLFYDNKNYGELHLTIEDTYVDLFNEVNRLKNHGYPITNHGFLSRESLSDLYTKSFYFIFPSLTESFGLGIVEALENGCIILGADRPYMHTICKPNIVFNPESIQDICNGMIKAINYEFDNSEQYVQNEIENLITLLK